jgi:hypothetical protein
LAEAGLGGGVTVGLDAFVDTGFVVVFLVVGFAVDVVADDVVVVVDVKAFSFCR